MRLVPAENLRARSEGLRSELRASHLDGLVVSSLPNIAYLTGFLASAGLLIVIPDSLILIGDGRYREALKTCRERWPDVRTVTLEVGTTYDEALVRALLPLRGLRVGFEAAHLSVSRHRYLATGLAEAGWLEELVATDGIVEGLRTRKDAWEIDCLRAAATRLSSVAKSILAKALAGRRESEVAAEIDAALRRAGFDRPAFDTIVASGPRAAEAHAHAGSRRIEPGDLVVLDLGGVLAGYHTDLTRTVVAGGDGRRERTLVGHVVEAQAAAFSTVRPGVAPEAVDWTARGRLADAGFGDEAFVHGTGHGLGLEVHEAPRVGRPRAGRPEPPLAAGMVLTLEPGAYVPGWGGARVEDMVLVTEQGAEWLTDVPRVC
jgi:Xaa-Pro aminopeptidase